MRVTIILLLLFVVGCASNPNAVEARYVDPTEYDGLSCADLEVRKRDADQRLADAIEAQRKDYLDDMGWAVAAVIAPIVLIGMDGNDETVTQLSEAKGEVRALEATIAKVCT